MAEAKAVPSYIAAEAETAPIPKIVIPEPPPLPPAPEKGSLLTRLGDVPMRVIYRVGAAVLAVIAAATTAVVVLVTRDQPRAERQVAAASPEAVTAPAASAAASSASPAASPSAAVGGGVPVAATGESSPEATPSPTPDPDDPDPDRSALLTALADPRVPDRLPAKKLGRLPGRASPVRGRIKDRRSGVSFARLGGKWRRVKASPFASRQLLPAARGMGYRGLVVSCPVPTLLQKELRDTAIIAARWTLNLHPKKAKIKWTASQPLKVGKRSGWLLGYRVVYTVKGKKRSAMAALVVVDVPKKAKPAMVFASLPQADKRRWRDINVLVSSIKAM